MVYGVIMNFRAAAKARGSWKAVLQHLYTNGDYPLKMGNHVGSDSFGNKYFENLVDYPFGQHRWVEYADIHNLDSSQIDPEWHGWMVSMNDVPPTTQDEWFEKKKKDITILSQSDAIYDHGVGYQNPINNFNGMHNLSQVRERGFNIGNTVTRLAAGSNGAYYTQPGNPYNPYHRKPKVMIGDLDEGNDSVPEGEHRQYKSLKWKDRLASADEKVAAAAKERAVQEATNSDMMNEMFGGGGGGRGGTRI